MARCKGFCPALSCYRLASLVATSAKTVPRTVFFRKLCLLPPCSNPLRFKYKKRSDTQMCITSFGALQGILSRAIALSPRFARCHVGENSPPDCFLPQASLAPSLFESLALLNTKKEATHKCVSLLLARCKGFEPLTFWFVAKHSIQLS